MIAFEQAWYGRFVWAWCGIALGVFVFLMLITAPYGRHARGGFGPTIHRTVGWILMEAPSPVGMALLFVLAPRAPGIAAWILCALWQAHYVNRTFVFPFRMRGGQTQMPALVACAGSAFNLVNAYVNGRWLTALGPEYGVAWLWDPRFLVGVALFVGGLVINQYADSVLRGLRRGSETGYQIPRGGLYEYVSCPNYLGEILEWCGWAVATWSLAGVSFALWTIANLMPRAVAHHRWYREQFAEYPPSRRAILPFLY